MDIIVENLPHLSGFWEWKLNADPGIIYSGDAMRKKQGRSGRPFQEADEASLFRAAFPEGWLEMLRIASEEGPADGPLRERWEAVLEIGRRALSSAVPRSAPVRSASDVFERYRYLLADSPVEVFLAVLLDARNRVVRDVRISVGILNGSLIHPREVFSAAVSERAAAIVLVHNHPSGDPSPSREDREVTERLRSAGEIVGIPVMDHVIITNSAYYSFRDGADG